MGPRPLLALLAVLPVTAGGCGGNGSPQAVRADPPARSGALLPDSYVRSPGVPTTMDTNPANLASAVVTYNYGRLPEYIDGAAFRLLPHDVTQASEPGRTIRHVYVLTVPRTRLVLDAAVTSAPELQEAKQLARAFAIDVALDGRHLRAPSRFWVFYRNNGPEICRIYFPGDLGSLQMGANSIVFNPLPPGLHRLRVVLRQTIVPGVPAARIVSDYRLRVLARRPSAAERAIAPAVDSAPPASSRTPLAFRIQQQ